MNIKSKYVKPKFKKVSNPIHLIPISSLIQQFQRISFLSLLSIWQFIFVFTKIGSGDFFTLIQRLRVPIIRFLHRNRINIKLLLDFQRFIGDNPF